MPLDPEWRPIKVQLEHRAAAPPEALEAIFHAPVRFGQAGNRLVMAPGRLGRVHRTEDAALISLIERHVSDCGARAGAPAVGQCRAPGARNLGQRPITLAAIAAELGLTPRTLQRGLSREGTSLRRFVRARRLEIVEGYLRAPGLDVKQAAAVLGYSDQTAFWRAFKGCTGRCPTDQGRGQGCSQKSGQESRT